MTDKARYNERWGLAPEACNCHHGSARWCPIHTQADFEAAHHPLDGLREALTEMVDAYSARPDTDEMDHPEGLTRAQVEQAWDVWSLRQDRALDTARIVLAALRDEGETT